MVGWPNVQMFAIPSASRPEHHVMAPSPCHTMEGHFVLFVENAPDLLYSSRYILRIHARAELIWHISMSELPVYTFTALTYLARVRVLSAVRFWPASYMGFWYTCVASVRRHWDFGEDGHYSSPAQLWFRCGLLVYCQLSPSWCRLAVMYVVLLSLWFQHGWSVWCSLRSVCLTRLHDAKDESNDDRIVSASLVLFLPRDITPLPTIQVRVHWWISQRHSSEIQRLEGPWKVLAFGHFDTIATEVQGEGDQVLFDTTGSQDLGHQAAISVDQDKLR